MKAVILAGGEGTRLRPYTYVIPKPMLPYKQKPILEWIVDYMKKFGFDDFIFTTGRMEWQIRNYFGDGSKFGVKIEYMNEDMPMGTAGCITPFKDVLKETFAVVAGDNLFPELNLTEVLDFHRTQGSIATLVLKETEEKSPFGIVNLSENRITSFEEKPTTRKLTSTMIYVLEPAILNYIDKIPCDFAKHIFSRIVSKERLSGYVYRGEWVDIGSVEQFMKVNEGCE